MSEQTPYQALGVSEDASFEQIQSVKNRLSQQYQNDSRTLELLETAYDAILMDRLRLRQEGKIKVPERIRFPERAVETPKNSPLTMPSQAPGWMQRLVDTPSRNDVLLPAAIFAILGGMGFVSSDATGSFRPLLLVIGVFVSIYFLNRKENKIGRAFLLTFLGLIGGVAIGTGVAYLLKNSGLAISGEQIASMTTFFLFWLISSFLR